MGPGTETIMVFFSKELSKFKFTINCSITLCKNMLLFCCCFLVPQISPSLQIQRTSPSVITLSWSPLTLTEARGFVRNYTIIYYPALETRKRQQPNMVSITVDGNVTSRTINGLDETSAYSAQISANNGAGSGPLSMSMSVAQFGMKHCLDKL